MLLRQQLLYAARIQIKHPVAIGAAVDIQVWTDRDGAAAVAAAAVLMHSGIVNTIYHCVAVELIAVVDKLLFTGT